MERRKTDSGRLAVGRRFRSVASGRGRRSNRRLRASLCATAAACFVALAGCAATADARAGATPNAEDVVAVRATLDAQVAAWNRCDLEGFMAGYWPSEHLVFMTREGSTRGFRETLERYRRSYDRPESFGRLTFEDLRFERIDAETMLALGGWRLGDAAAAPHGRFALVLRRFAEGWRVVSDYTTSDPPPSGPPPAASAR
jgi:ketosteroid isomerase-like protein